MEENEIIVFPNTSFHLQYRATNLKKRKQAIGEYGANGIDMNRYLVCSILSINVLDWGLTTSLDLDVQFLNRHSINSVETINTEPKSSHSQQLNIFCIIAMPVRSSKCCPNSKVNWNDYNHLNALRVYWQEKKMESIILSLKINQKAVAPQMKWFLY